MRLSFLTARLRDPQMTTFFIKQPKKNKHGCQQSSRSFSAIPYESSDEKALFLEAIAEEIINSGEELVTICSSETRLQKARIEALYRIGSCIFPM